MRTEFKKVTQIIWMVLAAFFVIALLIRGLSESIYIYVPHDESCFIKFNKITGHLYTFSWSDSKASNYKKWNRLDK